MSEDDLFAAVEVVKSRGFTDTISVAMVLGLELSSAIEGMEEIVSIPYSDLPGFPELSVSGHVPQLVFGKIGAVTVACMQGRTHFYEKGDSRAMALPLELMAMLGAQKVILANSASSVNADLVPGSIALITDHINFNGLNPLVGLEGDGGFVSLVGAYDERLVRRCKIAASIAGVTIRDGVYMWFSGPSYETPAEVRMARTLGADFVGTSIVPETIIARRLGLRVTAISVITNFAAGFRGANPDYTEARATARQAAIYLRRLLPAFLATKERGA
jgi:purine-nucleoside phosphorylase